jgi:hypothetical protein
MAKAGPHAEPLPAAGFASKYWYSSNQPFSSEANRERLGWKKNRAFLSFLPTRILTFKPWTI